MTRLAADPEAVAEVLFALGGGLAMRMLAEPARDYGPAIAARCAAACALVHPAAAK